MKKESSFKLVLCDPNKGLTDAWEEEFKQFPDVEVREGRFEDVDFDCVVSPANSFGLMDGGVDEAITMYFGQQMMDRVQSRVINEYAGEQPVGTSMIVWGKHNEEKDKVQHVAHTPTMIIPMNIGMTTNVYMAMKAMLLAVEEFNKNMLDKGLDKLTIDTVVCPGLGTGAGRVGYGLAASVMSKAYENVYNPPESIDWDYAVARYNSIKNAHNVYA
jgi:O-acetyl-ADP-ribose deacetylase (regulator of RNase III)